MARKKVDEAPVLQSWADVNNAFRAIHEKENLIQLAELSLNDAIDALKADAEKSVKPLREEMKLLEAQLKQFVTTHKEEIKGKTKTLNYGKTGFRESTSCVVPKGRDGEVIASLEKLGWEDCINMKKTVNKDALKQRPADEILQTGAYLKTQDTFWYEVDHQKIKETE